MPDRLLLDTNLLVLLVVGTARLGYIARHKRLRAFDATDYGMVLDSVSTFSGLVLNPQVLAETFRLAMQTDEAAKKEIADVLAIVVARHADSMWKAGRRAA